MDQIKMSVIVPTHGRVDLFKETIKSLLEQTSKEFEVIVTDDSSLESERKEIKTIVEEAISNGLNARYIFTKPNLRQAKNTNQGFANSKGKYLRILHSDDVISNKCIEREIEAFENNPDIYLLNHSAIAFEDTINFKDDYSDIGEFDIYNCWLQRSIFTGCLLPSVVAIKREVYEQIGGMREDFDFLCDWDWCFRIFLNEYKQNHKSAMYLTGENVGWRNHENSTTSTMALKHFNEHITLIKEMKILYEKYNLLSSKDLKACLNNAEEYRYKRVISDYNKYKNFELPYIPIKYRGSLLSCVEKLKKHYRSFVEPINRFFKWFFEPFSILYYGAKTIIIYIKELFDKKGY